MKQNALAFILFNLGFHYAGTERTRFMRNSTESRKKKGKGNIKEEFSPTIRSIIKKKISLLSDFRVVTRKNQEEYTSLFEAELGNISDPALAQRKADCIVYRIIDENL